MNWNGFTRATLCAAQTSPHQVVLAEGSMRQVRIDKSDPTPVPYGYQQKLERIGHQIGFPVYYEPDPVDRSTGQGVHGYTCPGDQFGFRSPHIMIDSNSSPASKFR